MGKLMRKAAALVTAGLMTLSCYCTQAFAADKPADSTGSLSKVDAQVAYAASVVKPTYSIKGTAGVRKIKLSTATSGATIYYTKDGSVPTTSSKQYRPGYLIVLRSNTKLRAIAVKDGAQSTVMTKTIKVPTIVGDVTGDGTINKNDSTRLKKYLAGTTSFICSDNADCDGNGKVNSNDQTLLDQYLRGDISFFPLEDEELDEDIPVKVRLATPTVTVYRVVGGKSIEMTSTDTGVTLYYTTNGNMPTTSSTRYTGQFLLTDDATLMVMAYKDGSTSNVKTRVVEVDPCRPVTADKSTSTNYTDKIDVNLSCATTGASIYYTTDGTDPATSNTRTYYSRPITLEKDTTIKAVAQGKGLANSEISTYSYKVTYSPGLTISGTVWDDTPSESTSADGVRGSADQGINDIVVYLKVANSSTYYASTKTRTINGVPGSYEFTAVPEGSYKVEFYYNTQKYRAYTNIVSGGNQALQSSTAEDFYVTGDGAFRTANNNKITTINNYSSAIANDTFLGTAITSATYNQSASNVNLALVSTVYGAVSLSMTTTQSYYANNTIDNGSTLSYQVTVTNNSPTQTLRDVNICLYMSSYLTSVSADSRNIYLSGGDERYGYRVYNVSSLIGSSGLVPKASATFAISGIVDGANSAKISNYAEITSYRYANGSYDKYSIPGNLSIGSPKEKDEAASPVLTINAKLKTKRLTYNAAIDGSTQTLSPYGSHTFTLFVENGERGIDDLYVYMSNPYAVSYTTSQQQLSDGYNITFTVTSTNYTQAGDYSRLTVYLRDDPTQDLVITYYVQSTR